MHIYNLLIWLINLHTSTRLLANYFFEHDEYIKY